jgi:hypothetical protein
MNSLLHGLLALTHKRISVDRVIILFYQGRIYVPVTGKNKDGIYLATQTLFESEASYDALLDTVRKCIAAGMPLVTRALNLEPFEVKTKIKYKFSRTKGVLSAGIHWGDSEVYVEFSNPAFTDATLYKPIARLDKDASLDEIMSVIWQEYKTRTNDPLHIDLSGSTNIILINGAVIDLQSVAVDTSGAAAPTDEIEVRLAAGIMEDLVEQCSLDAANSLSEFVSFDLLENGTTAMSDYLEKLQMTRMSTQKPLEKDSVQWLWLSVSEVSMYDSNTVSLRGKCTRAS